MPRPPNILPLPCPPPGSWLPHRKGREQSMFSPSGTGRGRRWRSTGRWSSCSTLQQLQKIINKVFFKKSFDFLSPGAFTQGTNPKLSPWQSAPPASGEGFEQFLLAISTPAALQVALQVSGIDTHSAQEPSTPTRKRKLFLRPYQVPHQVFQIPFPFP